MEDEKGNKGKNTSVKLRFVVTDFACFFAIFEKYTLIERKYLFF